MIGDDHIDDPIAEAAPQLLLILPAANWRSALEKGCAVGDVLCREMEIGIDRGSWDAVLLQDRLEQAECYRRTLDSGEGHTDEADIKHS